MMLRGVKRQRGLHVVVTDLLDCLNSMHGRRDDGLCGTSREAEGLATGLADVFLRWDLMSWGKRERGS